MGELLTLEILTRMTAIPGMKICAVLLESEDLDISL